MAGVKQPSRPVIGVTGPDHGGFPMWLFTSWAIKRAGGKPLRIRPGKPRHGCTLHGLVISGGADVDPSLYGQEPEELLPELKKKGRSLKNYLIKLIFFPVLFLVRKLFSLKHTTGMDKARDDVEYHYLERAVNRSLPILGICRGAQLINVFFGGSLYQELSSFYSETPQIRSILPKKIVHIHERSILKDILRVRHCRVNALHNQAIREPGRNILIAAREKSGVIQAIEHETNPFILGVQWHPEFLPQHSRQRRIFHSMVQEARAGMEMRSEQSRS